MTRTHDDNWDITESVGGTAVQVAMARMAETISEAPLFTDTHAQHLVAAATRSGWRPPYSEELLAELMSTDPHAIDRMRAMGDYTAVRTRYFDDFLVNACNDGIDQVVILAAGLDARAWRLPLPNSSTVVYEVDQPKVLSFKSESLQANDALPATRYVAIGIDLREDWPSALRANGFDASRPTAWLAEGLLPYLSATAQDILFERLDELSAGGSRIAVEAFAESFYHPDAVAKRNARLTALRQVADRVGTQVMDHNALFFLEDHSNVAEWLTERGWKTSTVEALDLMARYGRPVSERLRDAVVALEFVEGRRERK